MIFVFKPLLKKLGYLPREQIRKIYQAYSIARSAHLGQKRDSGEEYITHPLMVAATLADMHLDYESIVAALLHDVIEDTNLTKEFIQKKFGSSCAELVDGVTKLTQMEFSNKAEAQAESFRKMILAMSHDIRVILVKLADRFHNMQTLSGVGPHKQQRIARETVDIYAPIANRLGMYELSLGLESMSFAFLYPRRYKILQDAVDKMRGNRKEIMESIEKALHQAITEHNLKQATIVGREKHLYGIYKKMRKLHLSFTEIMDVYAFRIIVDTIDECYRVLGMVHGVYKPIPGKFKDFISIPKHNGYQSLHTKLCGPYGIPIEIQIRTKEMDQMANKGIAAHWLYKTDSKLVTDAAHIRAQQWLNNILEMQKNTGSSLEFVENVRIDLFPDEVYVFTPKGHIMELPRGATAVDFAYAIHTDVGNSCIAARVNRQFAPLSTVLVSGQTVAIINSPEAKPNPAWLNFVVTSKARSGIKGFLKSQQHGEIVELGKELLGKALAELEISFKQIAPQTLAKVFTDIGLQNVDDLYESIGLGNRLAIFIAHQIANIMHDREVDIAAKTTKILRPLLIKEAEGLAITFAYCCNPIPGDAIVGYFNVGHGLEIHTEDCSELAKLRKKDEKYMPARWADDVKGEFRVAVNVEMANERGNLAKLAQTISDAGSSINDISMSECSSGYCLMSLKLMVHNAEHLERVLHSINLLPMVMGVVRKR